MIGDGENLKNQGGKTMGKILVVQEGHHESVPQDVYDLVSEMTRLVLGYGLKAVLGEKDWGIKMIPTAAQAEKILEHDREIAVVIFMSGTMEEKADAIQKKYPTLIVVVLTAEKKGNRILIIDKSSLDLKQILTFLNLLGRLVKG